MKPVRRIVSAVIVAALLIGSSMAQAQALKQLPGNAVAVIKLNNPQAVSDKVAALAKQWMLAEAVPEMKDPLGAIKKQLGLNEAFDAQGDIVVAFYMPAGGGDEPLVIALVPVTDFAKFMTAFPDAKAEGNLTSFTVPGAGEKVFAAKAGNYAAITPDKELLGKAPKGMTVSDLANRELNSNDIAAYVDLKTLGAMGLPLLKGSREQVVGEMERTLKNLPGFNQKFTPVLRTTVEQFLNASEAALASAQAATLGVKIGKDGIAGSATTEFDPNSYFGKALQAVKGSDADLLAGLPDRKYFAFGGVAMNPAVSTRLFDDFTGPIVQQLGAAGPEAKPVLALIDAMRANLAATEVSTVGYTVPTAPGKESVLQQVVIGRGDAKKIAAAQKQSYQATADLMKLLPQAPGSSVTFEIQPNAKTVEGVSLDAFNMTFNFDQNTPEGMQQAQIISMVYGGTSLKGYGGVVDDKSYVAVVGGSDEVLAGAIAAVRKNEAPLTQAANVKAVAAQLPQKRSFVFYVALDNIINSVQQYLAAVGVPAAIKLPPNLPPLGISAGVEGAAIRADVYIANELIENLIAAGMQMFMQAKPAARPGDL